MEIKINEEQIRAIVKEETDKAIRKRIREMQGQYTSKGYLEEVMRQVLWDTLTERMPNIEEFVVKTIERVADEQKKLLKVPSKQQIIDEIIDKLKSDDD